MMNQSVGGIFDQMRSRRLNEEVDEVKTEDLHEEADETPAEDTENEGFECEEEADETPAEDVEEVSEEDLDEAVKTVIQKGKKVQKNVVRKHKRLTSAQKQALMQARKKAHTASAEKSRKNSNKKRAAMGLNDEELVTCPECGFEGNAEDFDEEDGVLFCPECGAEISNAGTDEACKKNEEIDIAELAVRLDECGASDYMKTALNEGKYELVQKYLDIKEGE